MWVHRALAYGLGILFIIFLLLAERADQRLAAGFLLVVTMLWQFTTLRRADPWESTHMLAALLLVLTGILVVLALGFGLAFWTRLYAVLLIIALAAALVLEFSSRPPTLFDRFATGEVPDDSQDEVVVEELSPTKTERVVTTHAGTTFHTPGCRMLPEQELVDLTRNEALSYGLKACKVCKP